MRGRRPSRTESWPCPARFSARWNDRRAAGSASPLHRVATAQTAEPTQKLFDQYGVAALLRAVDRPALAGWGEVGTTEAFSIGGQGHGRIVEDKPAMVAEFVRRDGESGQPRLGRSDNRSD